VVIVSPDRSSASPSTSVYRGQQGRGAREDGFAHLFEHLMFMGARYVPYPKFETR